MNHIDYRGLADVIGASGAFIVSVGTFILQFVTITRQSKTRKILKDTHELVNGQQAVIRQVIGEEAYARGLNDAQQQKKEI